MWAAESYTTATGKRRREHPDKPTSVRLATATRPRPVAGLFIDTTDNDSSVTLQNTTAVTANTANGTAAGAGEGGGLSLNQHAVGGTKHPQLTLDHINVTRNRAHTNGGGLYNAGLTQHTLIANGTFSANTATQDGGAVFNAQPRRERELARDFSVQTASHLAPSAPSPCAARTSTRARSSARHQPAIRPRAVARSPTPTRSRSMAR